MVGGTELYPHDFPKYAGYSRPQRLNALHEFDLGTGLRCQNASILVSIECDRTHDDQHNLNCQQ